MPKQIDDSQVYEATIETLLAHGYSGATTKLIAKTANINEVTLFRKYGNKADLVAAALRHEKMHMMPEDIKYTGNLKADLHCILTAYMNTAKRHGQLFPLIMAEMARYPELQQTIQVPLAIMTQIGALLKRYQDEGILYPEEPLHAVGAFIGPVIVNTMVRMSAPAVPLPPLDLEQHLERFIYGRSLYPRQ